MVSSNMIMGILLGVGKGVEVIFCPNIELTGSFCQNKSILFAKILGKCAPLIPCLRRTLMKMMTMLDNVTFKFILWDES